VVVLGACGGSGGGDTAAGTTAASSGATTTGAGSTASAPSITPAAFAGSATCTVTPSQTEGPYYIDVDKIRGDIREDREGARLLVAVRVLDTDGCTPVKDAVFEIWHCDAGGLYSGFENASQGGPGGSSAGSTDATRYLRGAQITNADGIAEITTIYPGWYQGRTVHIHAKVFLSNKAVLTTQLYFDDEVSDAVYASAPYKSHGTRTTRNGNDSIYRGDTALSVTKDQDGYLGLMTIGIKG
jgi:protocatechuate 3,4-dioxygenase beta subunit